MKDATHKECQCAICTGGQEAYDRWEFGVMRDPGWFVHFVEDDDYGPTGANHHTHGLPFKYNHPDLQIVCRMDPRTAHQLLWTCVQRIAAGEKLLPHTTAENIAGNGYLVKFVPAVEGGPGDGERLVLRVILPDKAGHLDHDKLTEPFVEQYADLDVANLPRTIDPLAIRSTNDIRKWETFARGLHPGAVGLN